MNPALQGPRRKPFFLKLGHNYCFVLLPFRRPPCWEWGSFQQQLQAGIFPSCLRADEAPLALPAVSCTVPSTTAFRNCMCTPVPLMDHHGFSLGLYFCCQTHTGMKTKSNLPVEAWETICNEREVTFAVCSFL